MKQIFFLLGSVLFVAVANAQNTKATTTASAQITKNVDLSSPKVTAPVISPVPSPVNLLAKIPTGWNIVASPSQPASTPGSKGGTVNGTWDIAKNSID